MVFKRNKAKPITVNNPMKGKGLQIMGLVLIVSGMFTDLGVTLIGAMVYIAGRFKHWWFNA